MYVFVDAHHEDIALVNSDKDTDTNKAGYKSSSYDTDLFAKNFTMAGQAHCVIAPSNTERIHNHSTASRTDFMLSICIHTYCRGKLCPPTGQWVCHILGLSEGTP
jgi:hypothetical protein